MVLKRICWAILLIGTAAVVVAMPSGTSSSTATRLRFGTTVPSSCGDGMVFIDTDATSGQQLYACRSGSFVLQGDGGGGGLTAADLDTLAEVNAIIGDANLVSIGGTETITGQKTFSLPIIVSDQGLVLGGTGNYIDVPPNDVTLTADSSCAGNTAGHLRIIDSDETAAHTIDFCIGTALFLRLPATTATATDILHGTTTAGAPAFGPIVAADIPNMAFTGAISGTPEKICTSKATSTAADYMQFGTSTAGVPMLRAGSIVGVAFGADWTNVTNGSLDVNVMKNGSTVFNCNIPVSGSAAVECTGTQARGVDTFVAGDNISLQIDLTSTTAGTLAAGAASCIQIVEN